MSTPRVCLAFAALADPQRLRVVELLRSGAMRAGDLAQTMQVSPPTLSRHLRTLRQAGLVEDSHPGFDARVRVYSLRTGALEPLKSWLSDTEDMWAAQLLALKDHIEADDQSVADQT